MKKYISLIIAMSIIFSFAACASAETAPAETAAPVSAAVAAPAESAEEKEPEGFTFVYHDKRFGFDCDVKELEEEVAKDFNLFASDYYYSNWSSGTDNMLLFYVPGEKPALESMSFNISIPGITRGVQFDKSSVQDMESMFGKCTDSEIYSVLSYYKYMLDEDLQLKFCVVNGVVVNAELTMLSREGAVNDILQAELEAHSS